MCTLATKWAKISSIYRKITKVGGMFRDFFRQNHTPCLGIFLLLKKVTLFSGTPPFTILGEYPPPPRVPAEVYSEVILSTKDEIPQNVHVLKLLVREEQSM